MASFPSCATLNNDAGCTNLSNVGPLDRSNVSCPAPLIRRPDNITRETCPGDLCCLPCPLAQSFYPEGQLLSGFRGLNIWTLICSLFDLAIVIAYLLVPTKRSFPQNIMLFMALAMFIVYIGIGWVGRFVPIDEILCLNSVDASVPGQSLPLCSFQGSLMVFGLFSSAMWFSILCINVFLIVVLNVSIPNYVQCIYHAAAWGLPLISLIVVNVAHQLGTDISPICGVPNTNWQNDAFFIPIAIFIFPAFLLNLTVYIRVTIVARRVKKSIFEILQINLRPLFFASYAISVVIFFWVYLQVPEPPLSAWANEWFTCIALGLGQDYCSSISLPNVNAIGLVGAVYALIGSVGFVGFLVFVLRRDIFLHIGGLILRRDLKSPSTTVFSKTGVTATRSVTRSASKGKEDSEQEDEGEDEVADRSGPVSASPGKPADLEMAIMDESLGKMREGHY